MSISSHFVIGLNVFAALFNLAQLAYLGPNWPNAICAAISAAVSGWLCYVLREAPSSCAVMNPGQPKP